MSEIIYDGEMRMQLHDYRGPSAYEIAVENGFEGSEEEWLESLKGEPGRDGTTLTVNRKRAVDGNITINGTDMPWQAGSAQTVFQVINNLINSGYVKLIDVVNDLTTGGEAKVLSAEQGVELNRKKAYGFSASVQIPIGNWNGDGPYTRDIELAGVSENKDICHVSMSFDPAYKEPFTDSRVVLVAQKQDALTFKVEFIPEEAFPVNVLVMFTGQEVDG